MGKKEGWTPRAKSKAFDLEPTGGSPRKGTGPPKIEKKISLSHREGEKRGVVGLQEGDGGSSDQNGAK